MKKVLLINVLVGIMLLYAYAAMGADANDNAWALKITNVDGVIASTEVYIDETGVKRFPLRTLLEALGAEVTWQAETGDILLDFGTEQWMLRGYDRYGAYGIKNGKAFYICNLQVEGKYDRFYDNPLGYSDISGYQIRYETGGDGSPLGLVLIEDRYYMSIDGLKGFARNFRSKVTSDDETRVVEFYIFPKPFYNAKDFSETEIKVDNGNGNIKSAAALISDGKTEAVSFGGLMTAMGAVRKEDYKDSIDVGDWIDGFESIFYDAYRYKDNLFVLSYNKEYYWWDRETLTGTIYYNVRNASKDTTETVSYIRQDEYRNGPGVDGVCYLYNDEIYIRIDNAKYMLQFCGYELTEGDDEIYIKKVSEKFDESLYEEMTY